ncbi:unnamed protein product [Macrosiphum euphorbiae]|uniref:Uncharacterized protein n=1 Tax=Macrosiphum euphorbiae TaxID=13131 RepID=A0AAV0WEB5_9HEMI|nr:unnamed protein product [Macrosiphum euphorbiae]
MVTTLVTTMYYGVGMNTDSPCVHTVTKIGTVNTVVEGAMRFRWTIEQWLDGAAAAQCTPSLRPAGLALHTVYHVI